MKTVEGLTCTLTTSAGVCSICHSSVVPPALTPALLLVGGFKIATLPAVCLHSVRGNRTEDQYGVVTDSPTTYCAACCPVHNPHPIPPPAAGGSEARV